MSRQMVTNHYRRDFKFVADLGRRRVLTRRGKLSRFAEAMLDEAIDAFALLQGLNGELLV